MGRDRPSPMGRKRTLRLCLQRGLSGRVFRQDVDGLITPVIAATTKRPIRTGVLDRSPRQIVKLCLSTGLGQDEEADAKRFYRMVLGRMS